jgi:hypothetical protein
MNKWANEMNRQFSEIQMTNTYMKNFSPSLAIKEMKIKTALRFCLTPVRMAITRKQVLPRVCVCGGGCLIYCWWECKLAQPPWNFFGGVPQKVKKELLDKPTLPLVGIYPKDR